MGFFLGGRRKGKEREEKEREGAARMEQLLFAIIWQQSTYSETQQKTSMTKFLSNFLRCFRMFYIIFSSCSKVILLFCFSILPLLVT